MARPAVVRQIVCHDWRAVSDADMNRLYAVEQRRWEHQLDWDLGSAWTELERGRQLGTVSGLVAIDRDGRIGGWTYYLVHEGALQIGGLVAESEAVTSALLADVLADPDTHIAERVTVFAFTDAPGLVGELRARGLAVDRYWYLRRNGLDVEPMGTGMRSWSADDLNPAAALLGLAFERSDASRPFAPDGTTEQWQHYVRQLVEGNGCGQFLPSASFVAGDGPGRLAAAALVTRIGPTTAHLAQLAVAPHSRRRGLGASLVNAAFAGAARLGCTRMTLLVGGRNQAARALYERIRFEPVATFVAAGGAYPRRSTSVAPGAVIMTRR